VQATLKTRFEAKFIPEPMSGCWLWIGAVNKHGYGKFGDWVDGRTQSHWAHRLSYELHIGAIPDGHVLDHLCRNTSCVNPDHLDPVPQRINVIRGEIGQKMMRTHCDNGHEFTEANTAWIKGKHGRLWRRCKACHAAAAMRSYEKVGRETRQARKAA
jgi:hypothetical protein